MENLREILNKLKEPLPSHAVSAHQNNPNKKYIEVDWYEYWVDQVAGPLYKLEERECEINIDKGFVKVVMRVHIGEVFRDGKGVRLINEQGLENAVDRATAEAARNAFDKYFLGWANLRKYEALGIVGDPEGGGTPLKCVKCPQPLSAKEWEEVKLKYSRLMHPYHDACVPSHLRK